MIFNTEHQGALGDNRLNVLSDHPPPTPNLFADLINLGLLLIVFRKHGKVLHER